MGADIKAEVNVIQISERLATLEAQVAHIDAATKRIEDSVAKVLSQIDKREDRSMKWNCKWLTCAIICRQWKTRWRFGTGWLQSLHLHGQPS
jgi:hypothetical protein